MKRLLGVDLPTIFSMSAVGRVFASLDALRNGRALYALLSSYCMGGLMLASAESALAKGQNGVGALWASAAFLVAFYGVNATGMLLMDQARGRPVRDVADAAWDALRCAHRSLASLAVLLGAGAVVVGLLYGLLNGVRLPWVGPPLFAVLVPVGVLSLGMMGLIGVVWVGPLTGPAVWSGLGAWQTARWSLRQMRSRLLEAAVLMAATLVLTALLSALVSFVVMGGGRALALLAVMGAGVDVPPQQLMAGLFGFGLRALGASGAPVNTSALGQASLIGGGVVFALALVLPSLVYLRACCAVYLVLAESHEDSV